MASFMTGGVQTVIPSERVPHLTGTFDYGAPIGTLPRHAVVAGGGEGRLDTPAQPAQYSPQTAHTATQPAQPSNPNTGSAFIPPADRPKAGPPTGVPAGAKFFSGSDDGTIRGYRYLDGTTHFFQGDKELTNTTQHPAAVTPSVSSPTVKPAAVAAQKANTTATDTLIKENFNPVQATNYVNTYGADTLNKGFAAGSTFSSTGPTVTDATAAFMAKANASIPKFPNT